MSTNGGDATNSLSIINFCFVLQIYTRELPTLPLKLIDLFNESNSTIISIIIQFVLIVTVFATPDWKSGFRIKCSARGGVGGNIFFYAHEFYHPVNVENVVSRICVTVV